MCSINKRKIPISSLELSLNENSSKKKGTPFAIGRRKTAIAKVSLIPGDGTTFCINKKSAYFYFGKNDQYTHVSKAPLKALGLANSYNITANTHGGGLRGQADAIKLAVARTICRISNEYRKELKSKGFLKRDPRAKERKKYGLRKARKAPQYSKR